MPRLEAASRARDRSRDAIAVTCDLVPFCMPGTTFFTAMLAAPSTPQRILADIFLSFACSGIRKAIHRGVLVGVKRSCRTKLGLTGRRHRSLFAKRTRRDARPRVVAKRTMHASPLRDGICGVLSAALSVS